jgi:hypothetical protein
MNNFQFVGETDLMGGYENLTGIGGVCLIEKFHRKTPGVRVRALTIGSRIQMSRNAKGAT